jgi:hypothetical protein
MFERLKNYGFVGITLFNTVSALSAVASLVGPTATPLTAYIAVITTAASVIGWVIISYDYIIAKANKKLPQTTGKVVANLSEVSISEFTKLLGKKN